MSCAISGQTPEPSSFGPHDKGTGSVTTPSDGFRTVTVTDVVAPVASVNRTGDALHRKTEGGDEITVAGVRTLGGVCTAGGGATEGFAGTVVCGATTLAGGAIATPPVFAGPDVGDFDVDGGVLDPSFARSLVALVGVTLALTVC